MRHPLRATQTVAIGIDALQNGAEFLNYRIDRPLAANPAKADPGQIVREILHIAVMQQLASPLQYRFINLLPSIAFTKSTLPFRICWTVHT